MRQNKKHKTTFDFIVGVLQDGGHIERRYLVRATMRNDALQIAFSIDGGCKANQGSDIQDETDLLELVKMYCRII